MAYTRSLKVHWGIFSSLGIFFLYEFPLFESRKQKITLPFNKLIIYYCIIKTKKREKFSVESLRSPVKMISSFTFFIKTSVNLLFLPWSLCWLNFTNYSGKTSFTSFCADFLFSPFHVHIKTVGQVYNKSECYTRPE